MSSEYPDLPPVGGAQQALQPGPVPPGGAPEPTEIVCVEAEKIFDYCFQEITAQRAVPSPQVPMGSPIHCHLNTDNATCHVLNTSPGSDDLRQVHMTVSVPASVEVGQHTVPITFVVFKSMQLYAPEGTSVQCGVTGTCLSDLIDQDDDGLADEIGCQANLCVVIQSKAPVKLLVPAYGLCVPGPIRDVPASLPQA